jgi:hypothetical protein
VGDKITNSASLRMTSEQLDAIIHELDEHVDPTVRHRIREVVGLMMELHGAGLERVLELAADSALGSPALVTRMADDSLLGPLLLIHDLHPHDLETRLSRRLDRLRPRIAANGCRADVVAVGGDVATVRVEGIERLSATPAEELKALIETTLLEAAPELTTLVIERGQSLTTTLSTPLLQIMRRSDLNAPAVPDR